jgi:predicted RNA binding protein YcfA (HicA-like mRNA interferase family)
MKVRDAIRRLEADGWRLHETRGDHRQFVHPTKSGRVTVAGHPRDDLHPRTWNSIQRQAGWRR